MPVKDLSKVHQLVSDLFRWPDTPEEWKQYELNKEQVDFFNKNGFVSGIKLLDEKQIETIKSELTAIADPGHPGHELFYEFHSNESTDPSTIIISCIRCMANYRRLA